MRYRQEGGVSLLGMGAVGGASLTSGFCGVLAFGGVRDFQLFVYNGNAFLFSGYPLGISLRRSICWLPKSDVGNLLAEKK